MYDLEVTGIHTGLPPGAQEGARYEGQPQVDFSFGDFLDIINPLQHIPLVGNLYRELTGDEISPHARILGDTLFGGPSGFLASIANVFYEAVAGEDVGETVIAMLTGDGGDAEPQFARDEAGDKVGINDAVIPASTASESALPAPLETAAGTAAHADAVLPEAEPGMLTGQDALNALFMDLGGGSQAQRSMPLAADDRQAMPLPGRQDTVPAKSYPLPPRHIRVAPQTAPMAAPQTDTAAPPQAAAAGEEAVHPLLFAQETGEGGVADRMMQALDKYQAMAQQRHKQTEDEDKPAWESDPVPVPAGGW
jgi:hypothetical protein